MISTVVGVSVVVVLAVALLTAGAAATFLYIHRTIAAEREPRAGHEERLVSLELKMEGLPSLWEDERKRARRFKDAGEAARKSAEKKLAQVEEIIEAAEDLPDVNGDGSSQLEMQPMRQNMGTPDSPDQHNRVAAIAHLITGRA